ncbi:hypothetical protein HRbin11_01087 [bacterium HR11]|nr:hypothetical protein HRbin11_01087 [bacterium HR11]
METFRFLVFLVTHLSAGLALGGVGYGLGRRLTYSWRYASVWEEVSCSTALGLGVIALLVFGIGVVGWLYPWVLLGALLLSQGLCYAVWRDLFKRLTPALRGWSGRLRPGLGRLLAGGCLLFMSLLALYPPTAYDATAYHLTAPKLYVRDHAIGFFPHVRLNMLPQLNEMLFTLMLMFYDDIAAQVVEFLMLLLVAGTVYAWGRRVFSGRVGLWGAALWLSNPLALWLGSTAYIDIGLTLFTTLAVYAFCNGLSDKKAGWLTLAGVYSGFAAGTKYHGLFFLGLLGLAALGVGFRERRWAYPGLFGLAALSTAAPWYLRNFLWTGNPFLPLGTRVFGYGGLSPEDVQIIFRLWDLIGIEKTPASLLLLPWRLAFQPSRLRMEAPVSPVYSLWLPILVVQSLRDARLRWLSGLILAYTFFWFFTAPLIRFLVPALPLLSLATAAALERCLLGLPAIGPWIRGPVVSGLLGLTLLAPAELYAVRRVWRQGPVPTSREEREAYLSRHLPAYPAYKFLNERIGPPYTVYALYAEQMAYFADGTSIGGEFGPGRYGLIANRLHDSRALYRALKGLGADYFLVSRQVVRVQLPDDAFFHSHFRLVYARAWTLLFRLSEAPWVRRVGPERLHNGDFESLEAGWPSGWTRIGTPRVDASGQYSHSGRVAVQVRGQNVLFQAVPVQPGQIYWLRLHARASGTQAAARLQVNWSDVRGQFLGTDIEVVRVGPTWQKYEMAVTVPEHAAAAVIYASPHEDGIVWLDDFSFVEVKYKPLGG